MRRSNENIFFCHELYLPSLVNRIIAYLLGRAGQSGVGWRRSLCQRHFGSNISNPEYLVVRLVLREQDKADIKPHCRPLVRRKQNEAFSRLCHQLEKQHVPKGSGLCQRCKRACHFKHVVSRHVADQAFLTGKPCGHCTTVMSHHPTPSWTDIHPRCPSVNACGS